MGQAYTGFIMVVAKYPVRLISIDFSDEKKERLQTVHQAHDPFIPKENIEKKLRVIFKKDKVTSDVRQRI